MNAGAVTTLVSYNDKANQMMLDAASVLPAAKLEEPFEMGMGNMRRTLMHIWAGEHMWLQRWQGLGETPWVNEEEIVSVADLRKRWQPTIAERNAFLGKLQHDQLSRRITYRDSKGPLFTATLEQMILQALVHSIHHRAQVSNMLRRLGANVVDMDFMYMHRQPA